MLAWTTPCISTPYQKEQLDSYGIALPYQICLNSNIRKRLNLVSTTRPIATPSLNSCSKYDMRPPWNCFTLFTYSLADSFALLWEQDTGTAAWFCFRESSKVVGLSGRHLQSEKLRELVGVSGMNMCLIYHFQWAVWCLIDEDMRCNDSFLR
jgi:hypothetical protein